MNRSAPEPPVTVSRPAPSLTVTGTERLVVSVSSPSPRSIAKRVAAAQVTRPGAASVQPVPAVSVAVESRTSVALVSVTRFVSPGAAVYVTAPSANETAAAWALAGATAEGG